jgi:hypothetical protein
MPTLLEQQRAMRAAILAGRDDRAAATAPPAGIAVYRNNVFRNLTGALLLTYPAILRLVGGAFFAEAAARFVTDNPPRSADLYEYGQDFACFLEGFAPARTLPYLADVARLEFAVCRALHARRAVPLDAAAFAALSRDAPEEVRLAPHPALALLRLGTPAQAIWRAALEADEAARTACLGAIDPASGGEHLAVVNPNGAVEVLALDAASHALAERLAAGMELGEALDDAAPDAAAAELAFLITHGFFAAEVLR